MAKEGGGGVDATPNRFFQFFSEMGRAFLQTKFLSVGSSLGHLSMKNFFRSDHRTYCLGPKIRQREGAGGAPPPPPMSKSLPIFLTMKIRFNLNKFWHEIRYYQGEFVKKISDNTIKDNVTVTSSNFSRNNGTIRILTHFLAKNHRKLTIEEKI